MTIPHHSVDFRCSLCNLQEKYTSTQKGVGQGWRKSEFLIGTGDLWFCPRHATAGRDLNQTVQVSVEALKKDIVASVRDRVLRADSADQKSR